jgi:PAS domain-containing protein
MEKFLGTKVNRDLLQRLSVSDEDGFEGKTLDGIPVITVYSRSQVTKWAVVLGMPLDELKAGLRQTLVWLIAASFAALVVGLLLAWFIGGRVASSITALIKPALALGSGEMLPIPHLLFREANELRQAVLDAATTLHQSNTARKQVEEERQQAEEARRASEARYRTLFEYAPDGIVIADPESYFLDVNVSMCRMLGYPR